MSDLPVRMDLDSPTDSLASQTPYQISKVQDWDWVTARSDKLRDFETVKESLDVFTNYLGDFQDVVQGQKSLALQSPENKHHIWGSLANKCISTTLNRKGPRIVGPTEELQHPTFPDWIKAIQGLKAGLIQPCRRDGGDSVYRGELKGFQVEISEEEMSFLRTFSIGITSIPTIRDEKKELELRQALLESSLQLARQLTDVFAGLIRFNKALKESCKDLEHDIQIQEHQSDPANAVPSSPRFPQERGEGSTLKNEALDLTEEETSKPLFADRQDDQPTRPHWSRLFRDFGYSTSPEDTPQPEINVDYGRQSTPGPVENEGQDIPMSNPITNDNPIISNSPPEPENSNTVSSHDRNSSGSTSRRLTTPMSTRARQIKRNEMERTQAVPFVQNLLEQGLNWEQIRERYKVKFGIWRTSGSLAGFHSQQRHKYDYLVLKISPSRLREVLSKTIHS
ncbi:hypothetical protein N7466_007285 [Penicillium verhagenii]|uniref:uncharacterized protein n=1 Tax=Penicillium verhagenii TaxID=1562060 RepID=UPI002545A16C|nr:uncharacterized protein N7466_007285 [Penicillium verhagenii]KAJ5928329.1 hypothetical protein N7466_007285 [Penicillium verhagenii]